MYSSFHSLANNAVLLRDTVKGAIVLVEGPTDHRTMGRLLCPDAGLVVAYGKKLVLDAMERLSEQTKPGFLGLVDSDFDSVNGLSLPEGVFTWDCHDLEMTVLKSSAFDSIQNHFCVPDKVQRFLETNGFSSLREALLERAAELGALRWISEVDSLGLPFDRVNLRRSIDPITLKLDVGKVTRSALNFLTGSQRGANELADQAIDLSGAGHEHLHLVRGHDVFEIFAIGLKRTLATLGNGAPSASALEKSALACFSAQDFQATDLYDALSEWESRNAEFPLLPRGTS